MLYDMESNYLYDAKQKIRRMISKKRKKKLDINLWKPK